MDPMQGKIIIKNPKELLSWYSSITYKEAAENREVITTLLKTAEARNMPFRGEAVSAANRQCNITGVVSTFGERWPEHHKAGTSLLMVFLGYYGQGLEVRCGLWLAGQLAYIYMGNTQTGFVFREPERWFELVPDPDYSDISPAMLKAQLGEAGQGSSSILKTEGTMSITPRQAKAQLESREADIEGLKEEVEQVKRAQTGELAAIQAEIEAMQAKLQEKKEAMLAELDAKMREMEEQKEKLEDQIYLLDSQIFAIRCYMGETVRFVQVQKGKAAPKEDPVVVHQKLRYLDEELGKLASLYEIQWGELDLFEEFLRHSPLALDTFAPNPKCIVLIRLSRTGTTLGTDQQYSNMLDRYRYFHGKTVGILIRNGDNLYLGWTDEEYVKIDDDLVGNVVDMTLEEPPQRMLFESEKRDYEKRMRDKKRKAMGDVLSRVFVSNILQGVVDHSNILSLPEGTRFDQDSPYIQYAVADAWLEDNRFGDFAGLIERCNKTVITGDMILSVQHLVPEHDRSWGSYAWPGANRPWDNSRGRGEANRTHDCHVEDCTIYPVNLVEYDEPVKMVRYRFRMPVLIGDTHEEKWQYGEIQERYWKEPVEDETKEFVDSYERRDRHVFVSVEKEENWRRCGMPYERPPRANFELYENEYINLTYMNSVWLSWAITQRKLGSWEIGGQSVDYAYGIRYLKTAMGFIRKREEQEKELLDAVDAAVCRNPDWPVLLSEWKLDKGVRAITPYQAKRFAKAMSERNAG